MSSNSNANLSGLNPGECFQLLVTHRRKWLLPTVVCGALALGYALVMSRYWEATQGFVVRREVSGSATSEPGKFADLFQMRTLQETILELAKSPQVIVATIKAVDPAGAAAEPTLERIEKFRKRLKLLPPGGAEFGKTEVCYLQVKDTSRERAIGLVAELGQQIDRRLRRLRKEQSQSLSNELNEQVKLAEAALASGTDRLAKFETEVGSDLGELRMLNASYSGQSDLRQAAVSLNLERLNTDMKVREAEQLLEVLTVARRAPEQLIAMPNSLILSQPTLRRLKDGLVDAQLRVAQLEGTRTQEHPLVQAANGSVEFTRRELYNELNVAIRGVQVEMQLGKARMAKLEEQYQGVQQRLGRLAELRAGYENNVSAVQNSRTVLDQAQKKLAEVDAALAAAHSACLMTPIDQAETGPHPGGLRRSAVVLLGAFGGLIMGMGWLFLTVAPKPRDDGNLSAAAVVESEVMKPEPAKPAEPEVVVEVAPTDVAPVDVTPVEPEPATIEPLELEPATVGPPIELNFPSSLPPAVAAKIAEIVAARSTVGQTESLI